MLSFVIKSWYYNSFQFLDKISKEFHLKLPIVKQKLTSLFKNIKISLNKCNISRRLVFWDLDCLYFK